MILANSMAHSTPGLGTGLKKISQRSGHHSLNRHPHPIPRQGDPGAKRRGGCDAISFVSSSMAMRSGTRGAQSVLRSMKEQRGPGPLAAAKNVLHALTAPDRWAVEPKKEGTGAPAAFSVGSWERTLRDGVIRLQNFSWEETAFCRKIGVYGRTQVCIHINPQNKTSP